MSSVQSSHVAVDLGASSGRVMLGRVGTGHLAFEVVHRFPNVPVQLPDGLHWDVLRLYAEIVDGLTQVGQRSGTRVDSVAVDSWGVDHGLLDRDGSLLGAPFHYRDPRNPAAVAGVHAAIAAERLYEINGLQHMAITTLFQLAAARGSAKLDTADTLLLIPDLLGYLLTGAIGAERTNASTSGLLDVTTGTWSPEVMAAIGLDPAILPALRDPGCHLGDLLPEIAAQTGLGATPVLAVGSHDTASAVVAVPASGERWAYISSGTWSLVGVELGAPILTDASRAANFTNEVGVDHRVRFLRNVTGLWVLQECLRGWKDAGTPEPLEPLLAAAAALPSGGPTIDIQDPALLPPGGMVERVERLCVATGTEVPRDRAALVRCILDSLAAAYAKVLAQAAELSGVDVEVIHVVGGGSQNELLCQLTADACQRPVVAGPVEATAIGNLLVQARAIGTLSGDLAELRALVAATQPVRRYDPR